MLAEWAWHFGQLDDDDDGTDDDGLSTPPPPALWRWWRCLWISPPADGSSEADGEGWSAVLTVWPRIVHILGALGLWCWWWWWWCCGCWCLVLWWCSTELLSLMWPSIDLHRASDGARMASAKITAHTMTSLCIMMRGRRWINEFIVGDTLFYNIILSIWCRMFGGAFDQLWTKVVNTAKCILVVFLLSEFTFILSLPQSIEILLFCCT